MGNRAEKAEDSLNRPRRGLVRRFTPLTVSVALACAPADQRTEPGLPTLDEIRVVIETYDAAWNRGDSTVVSAFLAPDYVYFSSAGRVTPRDETLAFLTSPDYVLEAAERTELQLTHVDAAVTVVGSRWRGHGTWRGDPFRDDQRCSLVLARATEGWRILTEHCTQVTPP